MIYCTKPNYVAWCYEFQPSGRFQYDEAGCTSLSYGSGDYTIDGDKIVFAYEEVIDPQRGEVKAFKLRELSDSIKLHIVTRSQSTSVVVPFCTVWVYHKGKLVTGYEMDSNGELDIELKSADSAYEIRIKGLGMQEYSFLTSGSGAYEMEVLLYDDIGARISGLEETYKILEFSDSLFIYEAYEDSSAVSKLYRR